jgi:tRNA threonylcarbamoyladenosine biosynthesis protein TsaB
MSIILNLETATTNCSVSVSKDGKVLALKEENTPNYSHSEQLHLFIQKCLQVANLTLADLDAIAVSKGPGSYTGLRIGVSAAKGLCYALGVPLIGLSTLKHMALQAIGDIQDLVVPVLDARRMEVYGAIYDENLKLIRETRAEIITMDSFKKYNQRHLHFVGPGAEKIQEVLQGSRVSFDTCLVPSAREMAPLSYEVFQTGKFEDVAYFEPFYLKDFILQTKAKKNR